MYSTASEQTRVIWAAHSYNVAFSDEIGHFQNCTGPEPRFRSASTLRATRSLPGRQHRGARSDTEPTDGDDDFCFPASRSLLVQVQGCTETNTGFDGVSYTPVWPDGNTKLHPTPIQFTQPA